MRENLSTWNDTIVALASPPGLGAIAVIRLSGPKSIELVASVFSKKNLAAKPSHTVHFGKIIDDLQVIDEVVVTLYKGPKSYTGEEVVEISCHGSPFIQDSLLQLFILKGGFSSDLQVMREKLIKFSALIELELDFSQEDVAFANKKELEKLVAQLQLKTQLLYDSFKLGNVIKNGVQVAIVGKPNAGKSTLLNTLLNEHRALVSEIPGTTRDTVEEYLTIEGVLYKLIDTAGIRSSTSDLIEQMGIDKSIEKIEQADIVIALFDASATTAKQIIDWQTAIGNDKMILVGNKVDLGIDPSLQNNEALKDVIFIAAKDKKNIEALRTMLTQKVVGDGLNKEGTIVTNARHATVLKKLLYALVDIETGLANNATGDLLAIDINQALHYLGTITGQITNEDQLDFIFSKFCIGK